VRQQIRLELLECMCQRQIDLHDADERCREAPSSLEPTHRTLADTCCARDLFLRQSEKLTHPSHMGAKLGYPLSPRLLARRPPSGRRALLTLWHSHSRPPGGAFTLKCTITSSGYAFIGRALWG